MTEPTIYEISSPGRQGVRFPSQMFQLRQYPKNLLA